MEITVQELDVIKAEAELEGFKKAMKILGLNPEDYDE